MPFGSKSRIIVFFVIGVACQGQEAPVAAPPTWRHVALQAECVPTLPLSCGQDSGGWAISLVLRRDPLTDAPEWLSGHRYALTTFLEQLPVQLLIIEPPWDDTLFFPTDSGAQAHWQQAFTQWLLEDFIPFMRPYKVSYVAFGRGWKKAPGGNAFWCGLLRQLKEAAPALHWGFTSGSPTDIPCVREWDFLGIDYQHFYPAQERSDYHAAWEAAQKPLMLIYPNLYEPDKEAALAERLRYWHTAPLALVRYNDTPCVPCP